MSCQVIESLNRVERCFPVFMAEYKKAWRTPCQLEINTGILIGMQDKIQTWRLLPHIFVGVLRQFMKGISHLLSNMTQAITVVLFTKNLFFPAVNTEKNSQTA